MSFRQLIEPDCGGVNALMQFESQLTKGYAYENPIIVQQQAIPSTSNGIVNNQNIDLVNEFLGQAQAQAPQSFQMDALLQEMREIEVQNFHPSVIHAPKVIDEVNRNSIWTNEFLTINEKNFNDAESINSSLKHSENNIINVQPVSENVIYVKEFFNNSSSVVEDKHQLNVNENISRHEQQQEALVCHPLPPPPSVINGIENYNPSDEICDTYFKNLEAEFFEDYQNTAKEKTADVFDNWLEDFTKSNNEDAKFTQSYNDKFWNKLQDEWNKISKENDINNSWLMESEYYDPYKEYQFIEENHMLNDVNALEKGKEFLKQNDIPNAVLCFESAVKQDEKNAEAWELLGISQAENEMDPHAIAALKKALELNSNNMKVLMSLAVSYTNESLQYLALKMLINWLQCNPKYSKFVKDELLNDKTNNIFLRDTQLKKVQHLFLTIVQNNQSQIDPDVQEALGILFTLSSEYDKAVDCFQAALQISPENPKLWNRLGASLANGNRSIEAVKAYQNALDISPGFIRARYNVGIVCMNLKAYKEAAEHLLTALNLQATSKQRSGIQSSSSSQMSDTIWSTLRMIISLMGKWDLQEAMDKRNLDALNKAFGESTNNTY